MPSMQGGKIGVPPCNQHARASRNRAAEKDEQDTRPWRSSRMLQGRIAEAGAALACEHLYGNGVSIGPNVCLSWVEQPAQAGSANV
jgi:hypothetical protein